MQTTFVLGIITMDETILRKMQREDIRKVVYALV